MSRASEARMEAMNNYDEIYGELSKETTKDSQGNVVPKYSEEEKQKMASAGARVTYGGNMALLPLDILSFRAMVYNPISGSAEGLLERGLSKIGNKVISKGLGYGIGLVSESAEEGAQFIMGQEGKNYAKVLAGLDNGDNFLTRLGKNVQTDEFWNNVAGGAIGSPIIGGAMNVANKIMNGNKGARLNELHKNYMQNVGKMDNKLATYITELESKGKSREAAIARRQFNANRSLSALHYDAMTDKDTAFNAHMNFVATTLGEINEGKVDALRDLGFTNPTPEQIQVVKAEFEQYQKDAAQMKEIYDTVKVKYNKAFVTAITQDHFHLQKLSEEQAGVNKAVNDLKLELPQYNDLTIQGKELYDAEYRLIALAEEKTRLSGQYRETNNKKEKENINQLLESNAARTSEVKARIEEINSDDAYAKSERDTDGNILSSVLRSPKYLQAVYDKEHLDNELNLQRKNIALWNTKEYAEEKSAELVRNARTRQQADDAAATSKSEAIKAEAEKKKQEIAAQEAADLVKQQQAAATTTTHNDDPLFEEDNNLLNALATHAGATPAINTGTTLANMFGQSGQALGSNAAINEILSNKPFYTTDRAIANKLLSDPQLKDYEVYETLDANVGNGNVSLYKFRKKEDNGLPEGQSDGEDIEALFSPADYDFENSSDEAKQGVKNSVGGLIARVGTKDISFEDLVRHVIKIQGIDVADRLYNALNIVGELMGEQ